MVRDILTALQRRLWQMEGVEFVKAGGIRTQERPSRQGHQPGECSELALAVALVSVGKTDKETNQERF
jgi:nucleoid DNA-binding protein